MTGGVPRWPVTVGVPDAALLDELAGLLVAVDAAYGPAPWWTAVRAGGARAARAVLDLEWVAGAWVVDAGRPVAFAGLTASRRRGGLELCRVMTAPDRRGEGLAGACVGTLLAWADARGTELELSSFTHEAGLVAWYQRRGFVPYSTARSTSRGLELTLLVRPAR